MNSTKKHDAIWNTPEGPCRVKFLASSRANPCHVRDLDKGGDWWAFQSQLKLVG